MDTKKADIVGADIPITKLVPLHERVVTKKSYSKILASIKVVGLIEPLCVYKDADRFLILDGFLRFKICSELGIKIVPCLILPEKEAYTCSRMVNPLSPTQESRMLQKSLETLDETTVAAALGLASISHRINDVLQSQLHPRVVAAFDAGRIQKTCAEELTFVTVERQAEILNTMEQNGDMSTSYARTLIVRTAAVQRSKRSRKNNPWDRGAKKKKELVDKLEYVEHRHDFFAGVYQQYSMDLLKLCIYARKLISKTGLRKYIQVAHPDMLKQFEAIIFENEIQGETSTSAIGT